MADGDGANDCVCCYEAHLELALATLFSIFAMATSLFGESRVLHVRAGQRIAPLGNNAKSAHIAAILLPVTD